MLDGLQQSGSLRYVAALDELLLRGTATLASYPYTGDAQPVPRTPTPYRLVGWGTVGVRGKTTVPEIKRALLEHGPLVAGVHVTPAFRKYKGGVFAEYSQTMTAKDPTNHAVVIIGWDDTRGKGCWHVQNSWGLKWGDGGGMWIEYGSNNVAYFAHWVKALSTRYDLPAGAHESLGGRAAPFPRLASGGAGG